MLPRLALPPSRTVLALVALAFVVPGLVGHDPWKSFDAIAIEVAHQMRLSGDWLVPRLAGEPWLEDPPLYHWLALAFGALFGPLLPFHEGARLASGVFVLAALWFAYLAARSWAPAQDPPEARHGAGAAAMLLVAGSIGLMVHAHEAVPDLAALAAVCAGFACLARAPDRPLASGAGFGASLGCAFLATGPVAPAVLGAAALAGHAVCEELRTRRAFAFLGAALVAALLLGSSWPAALWSRSPELAAHWWSQAGSTHGDFAANLRYFLRTAGWFAWPAWPLAAWAVWTLRREWRSARVFVPLAAVLLGLPAAALAGPAQDINLTVLLAPLALLGASGVASLRRGAANALDWFGVMTFGFFAALVWLGYFAMMTGLPPRIANNFAKTAPGFAAQFELLPLLAALVLTLCWLYVAFFTAPSPTRSLLRWAAGVALLWGTFATLWLPWADYQKSYRAVALQLKSRMSAGAACVHGQGIGAPQRSALSYHAGITTRLYMRERPAQCPLLITQGAPQHERDAPGPGWIKLADVGRPGDKAERYRLYRRTP